MSVGIIGGGAAGMMTAATLLESGYTDTIFLFDKNPHLGAKVIISGGGRCNVTTSFYKKEILKTKYPRGWGLIEYAIGQFGPKKMYQWFEQHGVPLKIEKDGRVFPVSNNGADIVAIFERLFQSSPNVHLKLGEKISGIVRGDDGFVLMGASQSYVVDTVVLATGGNAYRHTGSAGDGYAFAQSLGHSITALGPSLNSFQTNYERMHALSGISFPQSALIAKDGKSFVGPLLLTHFGVTGPVVFAFSAYTSFEPIAHDHPLLVKRKPNYEQSYEYRLRALQDAKLIQPNKQLGSILKMHFPDRFVQGLCIRYGFAYDAPMTTLHLESMKAVAHILGDGLELELVARRAGDEFVTAGGVPAQEIDRLTMQSLICPGLYIVGELLDVDGVTGGYNLTSSWSTGRLAGLSIAQLTLQ